MKRERIPDLIAEIEDELTSLAAVSDAAVATYETMPDEDEQQAIFKESLALKLHNYYTGCERMFCRIAEDVNGGVPDRHDWHIRLLHSMALEIRNVRQKVITRETEKILAEFLAFRHVVRNIYGFEIDLVRLHRLIEKLPGINERICREMQDFVTFLESLQ